MTGLWPLRSQQQFWHLVYVCINSLCLSQILYTGIVIYAPALALNQGMLFSVHGGQVNETFLCKGT